MTRLLAVTYLFTALFAVAPQAMPPVQVNTTTQAVAHTEEAALEAAWAIADARLQARCAAVGAQGGEATVGMDQVAPIGDGFLAEVHAGGQCR